MNLSACIGFPTSPENQVWFRAIQPQHWHTALQTSQTRTFPTRFNGGQPSTPQFDVLYLTQDQVVAMFEVQAVLGSPYGNFVPQPAQSWAVITVQVVLSSVADLSVLTAQTSLQSTVQELTGDWFGYQKRHGSLSLTQPTGFAPTQELGAALYAIPRLEGFKTVSAKVPDKRTLVIFPQKLRVGSSIQFHDAANNRRHTIRGTQP